MGHPESLHKPSFTGRTSLISHIATGVVIFLLLLPNFVSICLFFVSETQTCSIFYGVSVGLISFLLSVLTCCYESNLLTEILATKLLFKSNF